MRESLNEELQIKRHHINLTNSVETKAVKINNGLNITLWIKLYFT